MKIPQYLIGKFQETYNELLNLALQSLIGDNGFFITNITSADLTAITDKDAKPVLEAGRMFFVTDLAPNPGWQGIQTAAVPGVSNAVIKTFTVT